ncbi:hypothetical protein HK096_008518 [Nowakowskiella sp. JEL0078]|nr:hypothetical protein HK096_008518 [Nowakowskiella sp. JEL0078]
MVKDLQKSAVNLSQQIQKMLNSPSWMQYGVLKDALSNKKHAPAPLFSRRQSNSIDISQVDPVEIARQMCLIDERIFRSIRTRELLGESWTQENKYDQAPNVVAMITGFNTTVDIFSSYIISRGTPKARSLLIKHFILVAKKLINLGNYNSCQAIVSALLSTAIYRLRRSWDLVPRQLQADFQELNNIFSPNDNYSNLRNQLRTIDPPGIPWIGLYLRDLILVEEAQKFKTRKLSQRRKQTPLNVPIKADGSSEYSKRQSMIIMSTDDNKLDIDTKSEVSDGDVTLSSMPADGDRVPTLNRRKPADPAMIQFTKYRLMARILDEMFKMRAQTYNFVALPALQQILVDSRGIIRTPSMQFKMSIALEPLNTPTSDLEEDIDYFSGVDDMETKSNKSMDEFVPLAPPAVETITSESDFDVVFDSLSKKEH